MTPGKDCQNRKCLSFRRKPEGDSADMTSGELFQSCAAATKQAGPPTVDSFTGGTTRRTEPAERSVRRPGTSVTRTMESR